MPELVWYALSHGVTRPVLSQDVPLWFAALLLFGLLCAGGLLGSGPDPVVPECSQEVTLPRLPQRKAPRP